ncbi:MAG: NAD(P)-binding domain-containing protein, partial [Bacteroidales bacterium]
AMSIKDFCASLEHPRKIMLMVKAGEAVDKTIELLLPYIGKGDIIIDGGNSNYTDTERRVIELGNKEILYVGSGVSGGELGALYGPSIMPGGAIGAWPIIKPIFEAITAKVGTNN